MQRFDDAVVGAGIIGLAHAYQLARLGRQVAVFERSAHAQGASVRNFGMIWPIGQPAGPPRELALRSRQLWLEVARASGLWHDPCGSLHLAYHDDEHQVLREFAADFAAGLNVELIDREGVESLCPRVKTTGLRGALWSPSELCVDAKRACHDLAAWLHSSRGVTFHFGHAVTGFDNGRLMANGQTFLADRLWVCSGAEMQTLYPEQLAGLGLNACKLQMLRTAPAKQRLGPMLAGGLTLRHYPAFAQCPTLADVRTRVTRDNPEFDRFGIHVMAAQNSAGEFVIGDSHEYGPDIEPFDRSEIEQLILTYLNRFLDIRDLPISARWHGVYLKHHERPVSRIQPAAHVVAIVGVGGAGMTLSFGIAEQTIKEILA